MVKALPLCDLEKGTIRNGLCSITGTDPFDDADVAVGTPDAGAVAIPEVRTGSGELGDGNGAVRDLGPGDGEVGQLIGADGSVGDGSGDDGMEGGGGWEDLLAGQRGVGADLDFQVARAGKKPDCFSMLAHPHQFPELLPLIRFKHKPPLHHREMQW